MYETEFWIPSTIEGLKKCLGAVREVVDNFNLNFESSFGLHTVIVELVENAIIHGNKRNMDLEVRVFIGVGITEIIIEVEDTGEGFDLVDIPEFYPPADIRREGGRGIFFIKTLCSSCCTLGKGNIFRCQISRNVNS